MRKTFPNLKGLSKKDAREALKKIKIEEYEEVEKISLTTWFNHVIETEPKEGEKIDGEVKVYISKICLLPFLILIGIILIGILVLNFGFSDTFVNKAPVISGGSEDWSKERIIYVLQDGKIKDGIKGYEYCITEEESEKNCIWYDTKTKNVRVSETGKWKVYFRGYNEEKKYTKVSNVEVANIDPISPKIKKITTNVENGSITVKTSVEDRESGIEKIYAALNNGSYVRIGKTYTFVGLESGEYKLTIKVVDKVGNESKRVIKGIKVEKESIIPGEPSIPGEEITNKDEEISPDKEKEPEFNEEDKEEDLPSIDLDDIPTSFVYGSEYDLPSNYSYGTVERTGTYECRVNGKVVNNTKEMTVGVQTIKCEIKNDLGNEASIEKEVEVEMTSGEDEEFGAWLRLNLYYPEGSTNWEYIIKDENEIREEGWKPYTGPILVKIEDANNVYIRYDLNGKRKIGGSGDIPVVIIEADKLSVCGGEKSKATIEYDELAEEKLYKIGGGDWKEYKGAFEVDGNTVVEAKASRTIAVYDSKGRYQFDKKITNTDALKIKENTTCIKVGTPTPGPVVEAISGPTININTKEAYQKEVEMTLETEYEAWEIYYKLDNGDYELYTEPVKVTKNVEVRSYYVRKSDGLISKSSKRLIENIGDKPTTCEMPTLEIEVSPSNYLTDVVDKVTIKAESDGETIEYSLDGTNYQAYTGIIERKVSGRVYVRSTNECGTTSRRVDINTKLPSTYIEGPKITATPRNGILTETAEIKIESPSWEDEIYYSINGGKYKVYTGEFQVTSNGPIRAYYVNKDGKTSDVTTYEVENIYVDKSLPYVTMKATPGKKVEDGEEVSISISGSNYTSLEYSLDGVIYLPYTKEIKVNKSTRVYAKGTNGNGATLRYIDITTPLPPVVHAEPISIIIHAKPEGSEVEGLINKVEIEIEYDADVELKYYRIGSDGLLQTYSGPFVLDRNATIYAYGVRGTTSRSISKRINYLTTGIEDPEIEIDNIQPSSSKKITIEYAKTASKKRYKIDAGEWIDYTGEIEINENCIIYAYNEDELGNKGSSYRIISSVVPDPTYTTLEGDDYYILYLNYPQTSKVKSREYKWLENGIWKPYKERGILFIKPGHTLEAGDKGFEVEDRNGNKVIFDDDYYYLTSGLGNVSEDLFMRWNQVKPDGPRFITSESAPTRKLYVAIDYDEDQVKELYKVIHPDGSETGWLEYKERIEIKNNNVVILAKSMNSQEVWSEETSIKITNIDEEEPSVEAKGDLVTHKKKVTFQIVGTDNLGIEKVGMAKGEVTLENFETFGETYGNGTNVTVSENGIYTLYAEDKVGNKVVKVIEVTNVDIDAPNIVITNKTDKVLTNEVIISIAYDDSKIREYKVGNSAWKSYSGDITLKANDYIGQGNEDGSLTIIARGTDEAGNASEVEDYIYNLDIDAPATPIILAKSGYPIITEYGIKYDDVLNVRYDNTRDDITNYISLDNGKTFKVYTGYEHITSGTVIAKSVKKDSGLTVQISKTVSLPSDALGILAYDGDESTAHQSSADKAIYRINVDETMYNQYINLTYYVGGGRSPGSLLVTQYKSDGILNGSTSYSQTSQLTNVRYKLNVDTSYLTFQYNYGYSSSISYKTYLSEIQAATLPIIKTKKNYSVITEYGINIGKMNVEIKYQSTSVKKLYRINDGEWLNYTGSVYVDEGDTLYAKGIDKNGKDSEISSVLSTLPSDALGVESYDNDVSTAHHSTASKVIYRLNVDKSLYNQFVRFDYYVGSGRSAGSLVVTQYTEGGTSNGTVTYTTSNKLTTARHLINPDTKYLTIQYNYGYSSSIPYETYLPEIQPSTIPILTTKSNYSVVTEYGIKTGKMEVDINYQSTAVRKLYKISDGEWQNYTGTVYVPESETLYAKSIDKNGKDSEISSVLSTLPSNALGILAYDGDESTSHPSSADKLIYRIDIDESMYDRNIALTYYVGSGRSAGSLIVTQYKLDGIENGTTKYTTANKLTKVNYHINSETVYLTIQYNYGYSSSIVYKTYLSEIQPSLAKVQTNVNSSSNSSPLISYKSNVLSIKYPTGYKAEYSLDMGKVWMEYTSEITIDDNVTVLARSVNDSGKVVSTSSYTIVKG